MPVERRVITDPLELPCGVVLPNRIAKAAMSEQLGDRASAPSDRLPPLYRRWARGGAGLLITGNVMVDPSALGEPANVVIEDDRDFGRLEAWAASVADTGSQLWMQVNHPGRQSPRHLSRQPVAPSAVPMQGSNHAAFAPPRALTGDEVSAIVTRFAATAALAQRAGFAGVQIHGAHGYLVSQFLSPLVNLRDDAWGGDPERRMRFLLEVVRATRAMVGSGFPIGVKLNSADFQRGGFTFEDSIDVVRVLQREKIDLLEVSGGTYERAAMIDSSVRPAPEGESSSATEREAYFLDYARQLRNAVKLPLMLTGGFRSAAAMRAAIEGGDIDVVGLARPVTVEPDLPLDVLAGGNVHAAVRPIASRIKSVHGVAEITWHTQQIHRLADGKEPAPRRSVARSLAQALITNGTDTLRRTRG